MTAYSPLDRIKAIVRESLEKKAVASDEVEFEVTFMPMPMAVVCEADEEHSHVAVGPGIVIWMKVTRYGPEGSDGPEQFSLEVMQPHPLDYCDDEYLEDWVNTTWDDMVLSGLDLDLIED